MRELFMRQERFGIKNEKRKTGGFTMLEVLLTVAILALERLSKDEENGRKRIADLILKCHMSPM